MLSHRLLSYACGFVACARTAVGATEWIAPGAVWTDTDGRKIDAHGGGIVKQGDTFYWIGFAASSMFDVVLGTAMPRLGRRLSKHVLQTKTPCSTRPRTCSTGRTWAPSRTLLDSGGRRLRRRTASSG